MADIKQDENRVTITPSRDLVRHYTDQIKAQILPLLDQEPKEFVMDLSRVTMIDSLGIGFLINLNFLLVQKKGRMRIVNLGEELFRQFKAMNLDTHFIIEAAKS